jgi:hypothetical protein
VSASACYFAASIHWNPRPLSGSLPPYYPDYWDMVRPARLERATFWFVARDQRTIYDLAIGTIVVQDCALLRVIKDFGKH